MEELLMYTKALVYLHAQSLLEVEEKTKPEVVLARAGLKYSEIARILGKTEGAVAKAVNRAK
jgi:DNA-directed RNA polymerase specialized sigma24 family protein